MKHFGDITKIDGTKVPLVDVITGGSPCQDLSIAGKREGLQGERSSLFHEQISLFDLGISCGKTSSVSCQVQTGGISESYSKKPQELPTVTPLFLDCRTDRVGLIAEPLWEITGLSLGVFTTHSFGEYPSVAVESHLSQILEDRPPQKYALSERACLGILQRAKLHDKALPPILEQALIQQSHFKSVPAKTGGKGILIQYDRTGSLSTLNNQYTLS